MDIRINDHGSIVQLIPVSDTGRAWLDEHCEVPDWAYNRLGIVNADHRMVGPIIEGAQADGLEVG